MKGNPIVRFIKEKLRPHVDKRMRGNPNFITEKLKPLVDKRIICDLTVPWVCLQFVIVVFPGHTHLLFFI